MTDPADRALARSLAETHWRDMIDAAFRGNPDQAMAVLQRLDERIQQVAVELPPDRSAEFLNAAEEERNKLFEEYELQPGCLEASTGRVNCSTRRDLASPAVPALSGSGYWGYDGVDCRASNSLGDGMSDFSGFLGDDHGNSVVECLGAPMPPRSTRSRSPPS